MTCDLCVGAGMNIAHMLVLVLCLGRGVCETYIYEMDRQSTCNNIIKVYSEREVTLKARANVASANPPEKCIVYLESAYQVADGRYRLQIIVEQLQIKDCNIRLDVFNGHGTTGNYLRSLGCSSGSTDIIYTKGREATVSFHRPRHLIQTEYAFTLTVKTYADGGEIGTEVGVDTLPIGAIIGIVLGLLLVVALAILLGWCCCTGYIYNFIGRRAPSKTPPTTTTTTHASYMAGSIDSNLEKVSTTSSTMQLNGINYQWTNVSGVNNDGSRNFRRGVPRKAQGAWGYSNQDPDTSVDVRSRPVQATEQGRSYKNSGRNFPQEGARDSHVYEPYDTDVPLDKSPRFRKRQDDPRASSKSRELRQSRNTATGEDEGAGDGVKEKEEQSSSADDRDVLKSLSDTDTDTVKLQRFESEPDVETIASPMHVNAGVRASVPDLTERPPSPSSQTGGRPSHKSRKGHREGHEPDPIGLPPEAFDPVFTTPTSQEQYPGEWRPQQQGAMPFLPYGMLPMVPGQQTYAYAYQSAPQMGAYPGNQGAYFLQSVPTADGDMHNTAFLMHTSRTPQHKAGKGRGSGGGMGHPGSPEYTSTPEGTPGRDGSSSHPDMSLVSPRVVPPDPAHRSMAMKSFADPESGIQTTQVTWTDSMPDPSDPGPEDSSKVTRKTTTRVTTRSGHGNLPPTTSTLLDYQDPNPAFLAPSSSQAAPLPPTTHTPNTTNVDYYTGQGTVADRLPEVVHEAPTRNRAIKDRITFGDSTV